MDERENGPDEATEETVDLDLADVDLEAEVTSADGTTGDDDEGVTRGERPPDVGSETGLVSGMQTTDLRSGRAQPTPLAEGDDGDREPEGESED